MRSNNLPDKLFVLESQKYGDKYIEHLLEQYKIYVTSAEKISDRRQKTNEFFLAVNTGLVGILGFAAAKFDQSALFWLLPVASVAGVIMCYFWYRVILSYKGLNAGKYEVIHIVESRLPLALYDTEWEALGKGVNKKIYWPFTHLELKVPWVFIIIYLIFAIPTLYNFILLATTYCKVPIA